MWYVTTCFAPGPSVFPSLAFGVRAAPPPQDVQGCRLDLTYSPVTHCCLFYQSRSLDITCNFRGATRFSPRRRHVPLPASGARPQESLHRQRCAVGHKHLHRLCQESSHHLVPGSSVTFHTLCSIHKASSAESPSDTVIGKKLAQSIMASGRGRRSTG